MSDLFGRLVVPTGKNTLWEVGESGTKTLSGVIVAFHALRQYFPEVETGRPPLLCSSQDGVTGYGNPGGHCGDVCPLNVWGSGKNGRGKACAQKVALYFLLDDATEPVVIWMPPTSLAAWRAYQVQLTVKERAFHWRIKTSISLTQTTNATGDPYNTLAFTASARLTPAQWAAPEQSREMIRTLLDVRRRPRACRPAADHRRGGGSSPHCDRDPC